MKVPSLSLHTPDMETPILLCAALDLLAVITAALVANWYDCSMLRFYLAVLCSGFTLVAQDGPTNKRRDYSSPSGRLIGTWGGSIPSSECEYYGPVDKDTMIGDFIRFRSSGRDKKTKAQKYQQFSFKYEILSEDEREHRVTVRLIFSDGKDRNQSLYMEPNGMSMIQKSVTVTMLGEDVFQLSYMGGRSDGCKF